MRDFAAITDALIAQKEQLLQRVNSIEDEVRRRSGGLDDDFAEQAVQRQNDEVLDALDDSGIDELKRVNTALQRIADGTFGVCVECEIEIPMERLAAVPHAEKCIDCAELDD